jgi:hypothetical protein
MQAETEPIVPSVDQLLDVWKEHHGNKLMTYLDDMYGICELPDNQPTAILSLDLCEVLRETGPSLTRMYGRTVGDTLHDYGAYYGDGLLGDREQFSREKILPELMRHNTVTPVPFSEAIHAFLQRWNQAGVYTVANTSTLPGCETSTTQFIADHYPDVIKGILFPRNHDGKGGTTKASILEKTKQTLACQTGYDMETIPSFAIEDAHHHAVDYTEHPSSIQVFMPNYSWNSTLSEQENITIVEQRLGTIDTFIAVDEALKIRGIVK